MADSPQLRSPLFHVVMDDGGEWDIQSRNSDLVAWDDTARIHRWGGPNDSPMKWSSFVAWHGSKREGLTALSFDQFVAAALDVYVVTPDVVMDPTTPDLEGG
jgi:hypothetical protein